MSAHQTNLAFAAKTPEELTFTSRQKLEHQKYRALALTLFVVPCAFAWLFFQLARGPDLTGSALFSSIVYLLTSLIGAYWCFCSAYRAWRGPLVLVRRYYLTWFLFGLGLLLPGLGNLYMALFQLLAKAPPPMVSYADITSTLSHGLILAALLILPVNTRDTRPGIHKLIDALITTLCLFGVNWSLVLNPLLVLSRPGELFATLVSVSYPCWDILLILAFALFIHQRPGAALRPSLMIYALGAFALFWADALCARLSSYGHYHPGMAAIEPFWFLSALLFGIASLYHYSALANQAYGDKNWLTQTTQRTAVSRRPNLPFERRFLLLQSLMIYLPVTLLLSVTLYSQFTSDSALIHALDILCALVLFLLVTHYVLTTYENARLMHEEEQKRADAEMLRKATASLSSVLEMDLLQNHIVTIGAQELGFEAAALVLGEEYGRTPGEQSSLVARAVSAQKHALVSWRVSGQKIASCLAFMGQEIEILWAETPLHPPTPVHQWHREQSLQASLFVPLMYQGRLHGCLAFSVRAARGFTQREYYLANAFATEAANAIEHARLYELARESALFSQAMSNVAARLNSVVAVGMGLGSEIHHLICSEGASALQADLAILYVHHPDGPFVPQEAIAIDPEPQTFPQEWPPIVSDDYFSLQAHSSQPTLFHMHQLALTSRQTDPSASIAFDAPGPTETQLAEASPALTPVYLPPEEVRTIRLRPLNLHALSTRPPARPDQPASLPQPFSALLETLQRRYASTVMLAPLLIHRVPMGMLVLARTHRPGEEKRDFTSSDLLPAQDFAGQAAIAFTNARLYEQLHNAHRRLQELDQLKDQFMVTASHELRTPLTAVQGYLDLLEHYRDSLPEGQQQEFLEKASRGCDELVLLLNNVMDASRLEIEAGIHNTHLERVSLREVVENVVDLILLQTKQEQREVRVRISSHLMVRADPTRLRQVIRNLSANALKYSPPGTPLVFSARPIFRRNATVVLGVTDRGKGVHPQDQGKLFQRFVRLESDLNSTVRGSGLGLYISRRLIEAMDGKIWVESSGEPGTGSTFCVQLPMA